MKTPKTAKGTQRRKIRMIPICVQTGGMEELLGIDGAYKAIKEAGFDGVDANVDHLMAYRDILEKKHVPAFDAEGDELLQYFKPWKDAAEKYGLDNSQAHAPFPSYLADGGEYNDYLLKMLEKTIIGCDYMGCHRLIIHPFYNQYKDAVTPEEEWKVNIESYAKLIPAARKHHVIICLENMFVGYKGKMYAACCSDFETACKYIDTLNEMAGEKLFGFCLDTGHALLVAKDIKQVICQLGDRIEALHTHDNNGITDQHLAPYMGILDWNRFVEGLKEIHFNKPLSFETFNAVRVFDPELAPEVLRLIAKTGRMFTRRIEG